MGDLEGILETGGALGVELAASALAERGKKAGVCPNCKSPLIGPYCAVCGQERDTHRRSLWALLHDLVLDIVSFDSRILRTARGLLTQPGELACAFRQGRTQAYVPAVRLYLFVSLIFFLVLSMTGLALLQLEVTATPAKLYYDAKGNAFMVNPAFDPSERGAKYLPRMISVSKEKAARGVFTYGTKVHFFAPIGAFKSHLSKAQIDRLTDPGIDIQIGDGGKASIKTGKDKKAAKDWWETHIFGSFRKLVNDPAALNGPLTTWIPRVLFLLLPLYAILLEIFYIRQRKRYYFVDHLIFSLGIHTFAFVVLIFAAGLAQIVDGTWLAWIVFFVMSIYIFLAMKRFYDQSWFWTTVKFGVLSFIYFFFFLMPSLAIVVAASFLDI